MRPANGVQARNPEESRLLAKSDLASWLRRLMGDAEVIAPAAGAGGDLMFAPVTDPEAVWLGPGNPLQPPKQYVLPQTDPIVRIERNGGGVEVSSISDERARVIIGMRSCDARGMAYLRRMQATDLPDDAYLRRADRVAVVTLACTTPCTLGFCVCCDAGPFARDGHDVQLVDLGDRFLAEGATERGRAMVADAPFRPATRTDVVRRDELEREAERHFGDESAHLGAAMRRISTRRVAEELWEAMSPWCFECGGCNFICPTCYCFSVKDRCLDHGWERCRTWDSCQYSAFTLEASGHNPRERRKERIKRRFFHKVSAQYYQRDGAVGCVGCGRCVQTCLGTTDMPAVVAAIRKGVWHG